MESPALDFCVAPLPAAEGGPASADPLRSGAAGAHQPVLNYFDEPAAAVRYAAHRPRGQSRVLALVAETMEAVLPVERALDVGCGTGHSTVALLPYAKEIVGIDPSSMMLAQTNSHPRIAYLKGHAVENLLTHSSVIRVVDGGRETPETARAWFHAVLAPYFAAGGTEFTHEVKIHVLRRSPPAP